MECSNPPKSSVLCGSGRQSAIRRGRRVVVAAFSFACAGGRHFFPKLGSARQKRLRGTVALTYHLATFEFLTLARALQALGPRLSRQMTVENPVKRTLTPHAKRVMPSESHSRQHVPPIAIILSSTTFIPQRYIISSPHSSGTHQASSTYFATVRHKTGNDSPFSIQTSSRPDR
jgi:hypothetical protein